MTAEQLKAYREWSDRNKTCPASDHYLDESRADFDLAEVVIRVRYGEVGNHMRIPLVLFTDSVVKIDELISEMIERRKAEANAY